MPVATDYFRMYSTIGQGIRQVGQSTQNMINAGAELARRRKDVNFIGNVISELSAKHPGERFTVPPNAKPEDVQRWAAEYELAEGYRKQLLKNNPGLVLNKPAFKFQDEKEYKLYADPVVKEFRAVKRPEELEEIKRPTEKVPVTDIMPSPIGARGELAEPEIREAEPIERARPPLTEERLISELRRKGWTAEEIKAEPMVAAERERIEREEKEKKAAELLQKLMELPESKYRDEAVEKLRQEGLVTPEQYLKYKKTEPKPERLSYWQRGLGLHPDYYKLSSAMRGFVSRQQAAQNKMEKMLDKESTEYMEQKAIKDSMQKKVWQHDIAINLIDKGQAASGIEAMQMAESQVDEIWTAKQNKEKIDGAIKSLKEMYIKLPKKEPRFGPDRTYTEEELRNRVDELIRTETEKLIKTGELPEDHGITTDMIIGEIPEPGFIEKGIEAVREFVTPEEAKAAPPRPPITRPPTPKDRAPKRSAAAQKMINSAKEALNDPNAPEEAQDAARKILKKFEEKF